MPKSLRSLSITASLLCGMMAVGCAHAATPPAEPGVLTAKQRKQCAVLDADFARTGKIIKYYRAYKGPDGNSKIETVELKGETKSYYNGSVTLTQFGLGDPSNVVIVYGHANAHIEPHPSPYREMFLIVSGSSVIELTDGTKYSLTPGSMLLSEDQGTPGRGGTSGPCGYVAIDFQFKAPTPQ